MNYIIGTRGSKLALAQTEYVRACLAETYPQDHFEIHIIKTKGDLITDRPLGEIGGSGLFVKEIERALLAGEIQLAVHSMKDMPCRLPEGLVFAPVWDREDPRDVLVLREKSSLAELPKGAVIGTGSKRRAFQLLALRPDLKIVDIRGNVDTRLRRMEERKLDGIVLAAAGLKRLGMEGKITQYLAADEMIPAPTQGTLAIEVVAANQELLSKLAIFGNSAAEVSMKAERAFLREMGADCHLPVGAYAQQMAADLSCPQDSLEASPQITLRAIYGNADGTKIASCCMTGAEPESLAQAAAKVIRGKLAGKVILLGAGPGDPDLLTVAGAEALRKADCIVFDRLVSRKLLSYARPDCELLYVGKENHHHTLPQEDINKLLVKKAMEYSSVVRLKGGDPYVFGRGGEEAFYLKEKGVPFSVVPGISSAIAGLSYAGIPITHRGKSIGFHVLTAHNKQDQLADINFASLTGDTCVFLMGLSEVEAICRKLMENGRAADTPAAVISHATTAQQCTCVGTLQNLAERTRAAGISSPALIVAGEVVQLRDALNFFEERPSFGQRYLVAETKPLTKISRTLEETPRSASDLGKSSPQKNAANELVRLLENKGAQVDVVTTGRIVPLCVRIEKEQLQSADWLVFTSKNGVHAFFQNLYESGLDVRALGTVKLAVIGSKTAEVLSGYGVFPDFISQKANSVHFAAEFTGLLERDSEVWYIQNENPTSQQQDASASRHPLSVLLKGKCRLTEIPVYRNQEEDDAVCQDETRLTVRHFLAGYRPEQLTDEMLLAYDRIYFTNARSIERLLGNRPAELLQQLDKRGSIYVIGPQCQKKLVSMGITQIQVSPEADYHTLAAL